jgi:hypothetical protein
MTLIKKRDVKDYFASRRRQGNQIHVVANQPDVTALSVNAPVPVDNKTLDFKRDFTSDHSSSVKPLAPAVHSNAPKAASGSAALGRVKE